MSDEESYNNPLTSRYASKEMIHNFSDQRKVFVWRQLWIWLAECELALELPITVEQINEMKANHASIDFEMAARKERELRHDVMAHVHTFGHCCPKAKGIIHLGATSCFVTCNADCIILRDSFELLSKRLAACMVTLKELALQHKNLVCLGRTHLQPAQPTTIGKRFCLWLQDLMIDLDNFERARDHTIRFRSIKGATGTQASFLELFDNDEGKVLDLERKIAEKAGFRDRVWNVSGQTYPRKMDVELVSILSSFGASVYKIANDIRLLASMKEVEEPFEVDQIGSSAMPYKRNPIRCERICSISRHLMTLNQSTLATHSSQWLERTLDDSAIRRIVLPEAVMCADSCLLILQNVLEGLVVYDKMIAKHLREELPFMITETILMKMVKKNRDRQDCHEKIRQHSVEAGKKVKLEGLENDLIERIKKDPYFEPVKEEVDSLIENPAIFAGLAPRQTEDFCKEIDRVLTPYKKELDNFKKIHLKV